MFSFENGVDGFVLLSHALRLSNLLNSYRRGLRLPEFDKDTLLTNTPSGI